MQLHSSPHHDGSELYAPGGQAKLGETKRLRVRVPHSFGQLSSVWMRVLVDAEPQFIEMGAISAPVVDDEAGWWEAGVEMGNPVLSYRFLLNGADGSSSWLNGEGVERIEPVDASDFRATIYVAPAPWTAAQVMYQVFPDRFARSRSMERPPLPTWAIEASWDDEVFPEGPERPRQLFGGDLDGLTERLDHLADMGVTLIYLTPFFPATSNHRYDAISFDRVDPLLGGDEALMRLVNAAHERGMRVVGDLTTNHTGDSHEWFQSAYGNPAAPEADFYYWNDAKHIDYVSWYGVPSLPKLNWNSLELRRRFIEGRQSVVAKWLLPPFQLDGWRIDVANMTGRNGADDLNTLVQRTVRRTMDDVAPGTVLFAESTNDASRDFDGSGWQAPMSYSAFTRPVWHWLRDPESDPVHHFGVRYDQTPILTAAEFVRSYRRFTAAFPWPVRALAMNAIDTHDTPRFADRADSARQLVAAGLAFTLPGTPVVFAGDEFALQGANGEASRTPLPWSEGAPLLREYRALSTLRRDSPALQHGGVRWLYADDEALAFLRETATHGAELVVAFRSAGEIVLPWQGVGALRAEASLRFGGIEAEIVGDQMRWRSTGPAFGVWAAGGIRERMTWTDQLLVAEHA